jgi:hypothetical protein
MAQDSSLLKNTEVTLHKMNKTYIREIALVWRASSARSDEFKQLGELMAKTQR